MAKTISDEEMKLTMIINGDSAQKELFDLEKSTRSLNEQNKALLLQKKLLEKQGQKDTEQYKLLTATMKQNTAELVTNKTRMAELQKEIGLTGLTMGQLQSKATMLRNTLRNLIPGSPDYLRFDAELTQVNNRLGELRGRAQTARSSIGSLADGFNRYQALAISFIAGLTGIVLSIQKIIDINGKLSDAQSNVMKTTGMTKKEVDELTKSFGLLQTRTSRIDLLGIAEQGGRIGIAKAEIGDFVNVMNKASVSLGDSFTGGAEEVANKLGKIKFLFEQTKGMNVEEAYNSIGSAINDLGANGTASEANIADFTTRIGSLTDVLKPTIQETLALGTAFEESGIESEVSARAYGIFMKQASTETAKFAKVMRITQGEVESMINTNPLEFMLKFSEGMKGMSATDTATTLDALGISADGANKVIGAMGNNTARFRELIDLSNNSFATGTSLINEYDIKNNNLAATLEKISKTVSGWFSSETFIKWLTAGVNWIAEFIGATDEATKKVSAWRAILVFTAKIMALMIASLISYTAWTTIAALKTRTLGEATAWSLLQQKLQVMWTSLQIAGLTIYTGVMNFFGIATTRATASLRALNVATASSPWGAVFAVLTAVIGAYIAFKDSLDEATDSQVTFAKQQKTLADEVGKSTASTKAHLYSLVSIINDSNVSLATRKKAYEDLVKIAPEFNGLIVKEGQKVYGLIAIYTDYIKALDQVAYAKGFAKLNEGNIEKEINDQQRVYNAEKRNFEAKKAYNDWYKDKNKDLGKHQDLYNEKEAADIEFKSAKESLSNTKKIVDETNKFKTNTVENIEKNIKKRQKNLSDLETKYGKEAAEKSSNYKSIALKLKADKQSLDALIGSPTTTDPNAKSKYNVLSGDDKKGSGTKKNPNSTQEEINKVNYENDLKYADLSTKLQRQIEDDKIAAMQDGYEKELFIETQRYKREIDDLEKQKVHTDEIVKLDAEIAKAKESGNISLYNALLAHKTQWSDRNKKLDEQINETQEGKLTTHNLKLATIQEKGAKETLEKSKEAFEQAKVLRETKYNLELAALGNNERAKAKLKKEHETNELLEEEKFLNDLINQFNLIVGKGDFGAIDLSLLTPEQIDSFTKEADKVGLTLLELIAKKNELSGKQISNAESLGIAKNTTDIFGFTPENWKQFYDNVSDGKFGIDEMVFAVSALVDMWGKYNQMVTNNENKQLQTFEKSSDAKKTKLKKQLDSGVISQSQYEKSVAKIDTELDKKKADLSYKQAKRERMIAIASAISGTAMAVVGALGNKPWTPFNFALAGMVGAMGLLQLGTIMSQPLPMPGHESGLYPEFVKREQDGKTFKSKYAGKTRSGLVSETSHFLVAENGPEMVIDNKAWRQMDPAVKEALVRNLQGIKGFENGKYNTENMRYEVPASSSAPASSANDNQLLEMVLMVLSENTAVMKDLRDNGVIGKFFKNDLKSAENIQESINDFNALKNKNKYKI